MASPELDDFHRTHYTREIKPEMNGQVVILSGWVKEKRDLGGIYFVVLQDMEGKIQVTTPVSQAKPLIVNTMNSLQKQDCISVKGWVKKMDKAPKGVEIVPFDVKVLSRSKHPLPLDITGRMKAEIDVRLDNRILDLLSEKNRSIFKIRHVILEESRIFFSKNKYLEVNTPKIIGSATEGGAELFPLIYFEREAFLAQSPQLYKEELVIVFEKVYEISQFYRAEKSHTRRHLTEFTSIDIEESFASAEDVMKVAETLMQHLCKQVQKKCKEELSILKHSFEIPSLPFQRLTYSKVIEELQAEEIQISWGDDISTLAFRKLGKIHPYFYFITNWPSTIKPFYIKNKDDQPEISEGFDLMWRWIELASGGSRVNNRATLIKKLEENGLSPESFKNHLTTFDYGMPPHSGWAIGVERLIMMLTGIRNIREAVLFPRDRYRLNP